MRGHADAATLAAFREELLSARKAAQVSAHLAACPRCAALEAELAEVTTVLNRATAPPMPDALTARIQAALAAEAAARTAVAVPHAASPPEAVPAMAGAPGYDSPQGTNGHRGGKAARQTRWRGHDRSWLALRVAAVTAAVAVIAGGGYGVVQLLTGSPAVTGAASGTGAAAPNIKVRGPVPGPSAGGLKQAPASGGGDYHSSSASTTAPLVLSSGTNYQRSSLGAQASAVLAQLSLSSPASPHPIPTMAPAQDQARLFPQLQACLIRVSHGQQPLLRDLAQYRGHTALIVVLPGANGAQRQALAIAPGCDILASAPLPASG